MDIMSAYFKKCKSICLSPNTYNSLNVGKIPKTFVLRCGLYEIAKLFDFNRLAIISGFLALAKLYGVDVPAPLSVDHRGFGKPKRLFFLKEEHDALLMLVEDLTHRINHGEEVDGVANHTNREHWNFFVNVISAHLNHHFDTIEETSYFKEHFMVWSNPKIPLDARKEGLIKKDWFSN